MEKKKPVPAQKSLLKNGQRNIMDINRSGQKGGCMNEKFFSLPAWKQTAIINAGFRVFSQNSYKHSPMSEIAEAAGISKSLLFHYFHNKIQRGNVDMDEMEKGFSKLMNFWKSIYLRKE